MKLIIFIFISLNCITCFNKNLILEKIIREYSDGRPSVVNTYKKNNDNINELIIETVYNHNGKINTEIYFENNSIKYVKYYYYYKNSKLKEVQKYLPPSIKDGEWIYYNLDGSIFKIEVYKNHKLKKIKRY